MSKPLVGFLVLGAVFVAIVLFNRFAYRRFNFQFFTVKSMLTAIFGLSVFLAGIAARNNALATGGSDTPSQILLGIAALIIAYLIYMNFRRTNLLFGFIGSVAQLAVLAVFGSVGIYGIMLLIVAVLVLVKFINPVILVDFRRNNN